MTRARKHTPRLGAKHSAQRARVVDELCECGHRGCHHDRGACMWCRCAAYVFSAFVYGDGSVTRKRR